MRTFFSFPPLDRVKILKSVSSNWHLSRLAKYAEMKKNVKRSTEKFFHMPQSRNSLKVSRRVRDVKRFRVGPFIRRCDVFAWEFLLS